MKRNVNRLGAAALGFVATAAFAGSAVAQQAQGQVGMTLPGAGGPQAGAVAGESDHDMMIGTLAVGYLGRRSIGVGTVPGGISPAEAPVVGIRYWIDELLGIDAGLGFLIESGSQDLGGGDQDLPSTTAFLIHGGVPLALANTGHFSFQIIPELNVGFASQSLEDTVAAVDQSGSGFHLDIGARAGAEIHFGFIDIPQLSLQGSIGVMFQTDSIKVEDNLNGTETSLSQMRIATTVGDNPWNIFTSNVAALYYF